MSDREWSKHIEKGTHLGLMLEKHYQSVEEVWRIGPTIPFTVSFQNTGVTLFGRGNQFHKSLRNADFSLDNRHPMVQLELISDSMDCLWSLGNWCLLWT